MRTAFLIAAILGLAGIAIIELANGNLKLGVAGALLAIANGLLLA